jgi:hypothetical protein
MEVRDGNIETGAKMLGVSIACCMLVRGARSTPELRGWLV